VFISHDLAVIRYISNRVAVMYLGTIMEIGGTEDVYRRPRHPYTAALLAATPEPRFGGERKNAPLKGEVPSPMNIPPGCRFHTRCRKAQDICRLVVPSLAGSERDHAAACHFPENI
jgi:oligopeptide/dipeptide ABC transporter ATP-binding protein